MDAVLTVNAEGDTATNFRPTHEKLDSYRKALADVFPSETAAETEVTMEAAQPGLGPLAQDDPAAAPQGPMGAGFSGAIRNRADVVRAIDAICIYYKAMEPGSPVPFLLQRARDWTELDFMAVLEDLVPSGLDEAARVLRSTRALSSVPEPAPEAAAWNGANKSSDW